MQYLVPQAKILEIWAACEKFWLGKLIPTSEITCFVPPSTQFMSTSHEPNPPFTQGRIYLIRDRVQHQGAGLSDSTDKFISPNNFSTFHPFPCLIFVIFYENVYPTRILGMVHSRYFRYHFLFSVRWEPKRKSFSNEYILYNIS